MLLTRRRLLAVAACTTGAGLAGCTPDPTVAGDPGSAFSPTPEVPVQGPLAVRAASALAPLQGVVAGAVTGVAAWPDAPAGYAAALAELAAQLTAQQQRLATTDPLVDGLEPMFEIPAAAPAVVANLAAATTQLATASTSAVTALRQCVTEATTQPERLLHLSLALASAAARLPSLAGMAGTATPIRFPDSAAEPSLAVALSHVLALVNGLEVGLGRLGSKDRLFASGTVRLDQVRQLRLDLRDAMTEPLEQEVGYDLPTAMGTPAEIRAGWAMLEHRVLDGLARGVATSDAAAVTRWLDPALAQVSHTQAWGGRLPVWPGWAPR